MSHSEIKVQVFSKKFIPYPLKVALIFSITTVIISTGILYYFYSFSKKNILHSLQNRIADVGKTGMHLFKEKDYQYLIRLKKELNQKLENIYKKNPSILDEIKKVEPGDTYDILTEEENEEFYQREESQNIVQIIRKIKAGTMPQLELQNSYSIKFYQDSNKPFLRFVYILAEIDLFKERDFLMFLMDSDMEEVDINNNGKIDPDEEPQHMGQMWNVKKTIFLQKAFKEQQLQCEREFYEDQWGRWLSCYVPIFDYQKQFIGVLGLDLDVNSEYNQLSSLRNLLIILLIILVFGIFILTYLSASLFLKPIINLSNASKEVANKNYNVRLNIPSNDEVGILTENFNNMVKEIKHYTEHLEELVKQRTLELENSLKQVQELKLKQDGDYFLTSQLLKPLNVNEVKDDGLVKVEMKIDYYKKFQFRHWNSEIGGDLCYAHKITLRGKDYIFCANADAMGKSIQGAGGALVFGSVLEAIVERTLYEDSVKQQFPEVWLKNSFIELHKVFESFDGTMLVSCILLLLDERDGCVYHINAEHPNLVLMSGDIVKFIVPRKAYMKLGISKEGLIEIDVLKLKEGDRLFLGSDGKDDLVLGQKDGVRIINEEETLFLDIVKESNGDLEMIYQNLKERAELMDDLSLISIEYRGDKEYLMQSRYIPKEDKMLYDKAVTLMEEGKNEESYTILLDLKNRYEQNGIVRKRLGFVLLRLGKIKQGIEELEIASELIPWDSDVIKILSKSYFKIRDFEKAREYGELYLLRESEDKEMIKYLIEVYQRLKESFRDKYKEVADKKIHKYQKLLSVA
jgi:HAMP domain-containing protein